MIRLATYFMNNDIEFRWDPTEKTLTTGDFIIKYDDESGLYEVEDFDSGHTDKLDYHELVTEI